MQAVRLDVASLNALRDGFRGRLVLPGDDNYDRARAVWNAMADRHPAIVARCAAITDVVAALRFAREHGLPIAVRGGGHSVAGFSTCDAGMLIDLSGMRRVRVDPKARTAWVEGGALLDQLDQAAQAFGLACPVGVIGHTGVAGLTLGGGMGRMQRLHGFTIDNLISIDVVTASGEQVRASDNEHPDLFWGLRGAGANFGIATAFVFRLHPVGPVVTQGSVLFPASLAREAAALYREVARTAPRRMSVALNVQRATSEPPFGPKMAGEAVVALGSTHFGSEKEAETDLHRLRHELEPLADTFAAKNYVSVQTMSDEAMAWGKRFYMKGGFLADLPDAAIDSAVRQIADAPGGGEMTLWAQGGAIADLPEDATAFAGRHAAFWLGIESAWLESASDGANIAWGRDTMSALKPFTVAGQYVNDVVESGEDVVRGIYGNAKYERLRALKRAYDPENVFRLNQNIRP